MAVMENRKRRPPLQHEVIRLLSAVGSALSTYGIAAVSSRMGWSVTMVLWAVIALLGTLLCGFSARRWGNFTRKTEE